jgi:hypothetical protein
LSTKTLGTSATTSLNPALQFLPGYNSGIAAADVASMSTHIKNDLNGSHPIIPESFSSNGLLYVPNRGILKMLPGDWVGIDSQGWPILVSKNSIANASWTHS